jgi:hypothetical protein
VKPYETRSWQAPKSLIGKRIAIHAAKALDDLRELAEYMADLNEFGGPCDDNMMAFNNAIARLGFAKFADLPRGAIIGTVVLEASLPTATLVDSGPFGDFSPGRFAWRMSDPQALAEPIPFRGMQGFFDVPDSAFVLPCNEDGQ